MTLTVAKKEGIWASELLAKLAKISMKSREKEERGEAKKEYCIATTTSPPSPHPLCSELGQYFLRFCT